MVRALGVAALVGGMTGCVSFDEVHCADGHVCPAGTKCDDTLGCVSPQQVDACLGLADGASCAVAGAEGICTNGACGLFYCGDGKRDGQEQCEGSDLGQTADGQAIDCSTLGFYEPSGLSCTPYCRYDVSRCSGFCGDGVVNGPEQCDSAPPFGESCLDFSFDAGRLGCTLCAPGFGGCTRFGWARIPSPTFQRLRGIWGAASGDFYVVGLAGTLLHYDGTELSAITPALTGDDLNGVWGSSSTDVFAVGSNGVILHDAGTGFAVQTSNTVQSLAAVWGSSSSDVFAVGVGGTILHYDGTTWSTASSPTSNALLAVWGSSAMDVYAAGMPGTSATVLHFDGTSWSALSPTVGAMTVFAIWGSGPHDVYFAGKSAGGAATVIHYDGVSTWAQVDPSPPLTMPTPSQYSGIWGSGSSEAFAGGDALLHYDGAKWSRLISPPDFERVWAMWGSPDGDVWAVGELGYVAHWGGASWTVPPSPAPIATLRGVWSFASSDAIAVGFSGQILRYDGANWPPATNLPASSDQLYSIWAAGPSAIFAVGLNSGTNAGVGYQFNGTSWAAVPGCAGATLPELLAVSGISASNVEATGFNGAYRSLGANCWATPASQPSTMSALFGTWASSSGVFAAGTPVTGMNDVLFGLVGATWSLITAPPPAVGYLNGVWGSDPSNVFAVGDTILRYNGSSWTHSFDHAGNLRGVSGTGPRNVFAVGDFGALFHYDGISWTPIRVPTTSHLRGVAATSRSVIVVGDGGYANRLAFSVRATETNCSDGWDDDGDGMPDCADSDCAGKPYCTSGGACPFVNAKDLECGSMIKGSTVGRTPSRDYYTCDANAETGPESIYRFKMPMDVSATVTLSGFAPSDLDLVVVGAMAASEACDPDFACLGASSTASDPETVSFAASAMRPYYLIVEGRNGAAADFMLSISCP